jgi:hypothetical protein
VLTFPQNEQANCRDSIGGIFATAFPSLLNAASAAAASACISAFDTFGPRILVMGEIPSDRALLRMSIAARAL